MKLIIDSFVTKNQEMTPWFVDCLTKYREHGYNPTIKINPTTQEDELRNGTTYNNFLNSLIKYQGEDLLIGEDDVLIDIDFEDLKEICKPYKNCVLRVVYKKKLKNPAGKTGYYYIGNQLTYVPQDYQEKLIKIMKEYTPSHVDCFFSRCCELNHKILPRPLGKEISHFSHTLQKFRK